MRTLTEIMEGIFAPGTQRSVAKIMGVSEFEVVDVSSADVTPTMQNCKCIWFDGEGKIKLDIYNDGNGTTSTKIFTVTASNFIQIANVVKVYKEVAVGTDASSTVTKHDNSDVIGVTLCR